MVDPEGLFNKSKFVVGFVTAFHGVSLTGVWLAGTYAGGVFNPTLGVIMAVKLSPALVLGLYDIYHGIDMMIKAASEPTNCLKSQPDGLEDNHFIGTHYVRL